MASSMGVCDRRVKQKAHRCMISIPPFPPQKPSQVVNSHAWIAKPLPDIDCPNLNTPPPRPSPSSHRKSHPGVQHPIYKMRHDFFFSFFFCMRAQRVACSNTSFTPSFVLAEHSRYFSARMIFFTASPSASVTGF